MSARNTELQNFAQREGFELQPTMHRINAEHGAVHSRARGTTVQGSGSSKVKCKRAENHDDATTAASMEAQTMRGVKRLTKTK